MEYFQYDVLKEVSRFVVHNQWMRDNSTSIRSETGMKFPAPKSHSPWRNYLRVFKLCFLVSETNGVAVPTPVAFDLIHNDNLTCDEYLHFLVRAATDPSPALSGWRKATDIQNVRFPLSFSIKYLLTRLIVYGQSTTPINETIEAYQESRFHGTENVSQFSELLTQRSQFNSTRRRAAPRQARESLKLISQISYLRAERSKLFVSLDETEATEVFNLITPIPGPRHTNGEDEIQRVATSSRTDKLVGNKSSLLQFKTNELDYEFIEGGKLAKNHMQIERNPNIRKAYFKKFPTSVCDACSLDTQLKYPWVQRVLDLHHILPLSSGKRLNRQGRTILEDLRPVCPSCHRAIHKFYNQYLRKANRLDFRDRKEALNVYLESRKKILRNFNRRVE